MAKANQDPGPDRLDRFLVLLVVALVPSCASRTSPEVVVPPSQSRFVRLEVPVPGTDRQYPIWRTRSPGRPVMMLHPLNGPSPDLLNLALEMESWGYRVYVPSLYGDPIRGEPAFGYDKELSSIRLLRTSGTWNPVSTESTGPIVDDVTAMARWVSCREGGRSLAVIGNSLTGAFPLAILDEPCVRLAVLGQPALPARRLGAVLLRIPQSERKRHALPLAEEDWDALLASLRRDPGKRIVGFHYVEDPMAAVERFDTLHGRLAARGFGERFRAYLLTPRGAGGSFPGWVIAGETEESRAMTTPHSTYLDAADPSDRAWFRKRLREELDQSW